MSEQIKNSEQPEEQLPVDESLKVIDSKTIYKTKKWWCSVVLVNAFGHDKIMVYLWQWVESKKLINGVWTPTGLFRWKVQQKMGINFEQNWEDIKKAVDGFMPRIKAVNV